MRRVFAALCRHSLIEVAEHLNREGVPRRGGLWTRDSVKDIVRRGRVYLGYVVEKRGRDERPGRHEPILTEAEVPSHPGGHRRAHPHREQARPVPALPAARAGLLQLRHAHARGSPRPARKRGALLPLSDARLSGPALSGRSRGSRGPRTDRPGRAARCPDRQRPQGASPASRDPGAGHGGPAAGPPAEAPRTAAEAARLGDLSDAQYKSQRDAARAALAELPDGDRIVAFDAHRARVLELPHAIAAASPARREELCRIVVEQVVVRDRRLAGITWTPPVRPFLDGSRKQRAVPPGAGDPPAVR